MNIYVLLENLAPVRGMPAAWIVVVAAFLAVVISDLRLSIPMLGVQYLFSGLLYAEVLDPRLAVVFVITGLVVTLILLVTGGQVHWGKTPTELKGINTNKPETDQLWHVGPLALSRRTWLRFALGIVAVVVAFVLARFGGFLLGGLSADPSLSLAIYGLGFLGLIGLLTADQPMPAGISLLLFINAFALFYGLLNPSTIVVILLVAMQLSVAVVVAYLTQARWLSETVRDF
jgi:hypothetical protein